MTVHENRLNELFVKGESKFEDNFMSSDTENL